MCVLGVSHIIEPFIHHRLAAEAKRPSSVSPIIIQEDSYKYKRTDPSPLGRINYGSKFLPLFATIAYNEGGEEKHFFFLKMKRRGRSLPLPLSPSC